MTRVMQIFREPIVHFMLGGSILFGLLSWVAGDRVTEASADLRHVSDRIVVEREALLSFIQAKTKNPDEADVRRVLEELDPRGRQLWIDRYVREEALVREALVLGLDRDDEIIRRRLAQKIEFLTLGLLEDELKVTEAELARFYRAHGDEYRLPATVTFTHVFVRELVGSEESRASRGLPAGNASGAGAVSGGQAGGLSMSAGSDGGLDRAEVLLEMLNREEIPFRDGLQFGDRFLYNRNYVDRTIEEILSHFGSEFVDALTSTMPDRSRWAGPFRSTHGWHLVLFTRQNESAIPRIDEIAGPLHDDLLRQKRDAVLESAIDALVAKYQVEVKLKD